MMGDLFLASVFVYSQKCVRYVKYVENQSDLTLILFWKEKSKTEKKKLTYHLWGVFWERQKASCLTQVSKDQSF